MTQLEEFAIRSNRAPGATERAVSAKSDQRQRTEQALHDIDLALVGQPQSLDLQSLRARTLLSLGRDLEARTAYLGILQRNPDHLEALTNLGRNLATNGFRMEARVLLERAVARYPGDAVSHVNLGTLLYQGDEPIAARALYQKALQL